MTASAFLWLAILGVPADDPVVLQRQVTEGQRAIYRVTTDIDADGSRFRYTGRSEEVIERVDPSGTFVIRSTQLEGTLRFGEETFRAPAERPTRLRRATSGAILEIVGVASDPDRYRLATLDAFYYPADPVRPGSTWRREGDGNVRQGAPPYRADYTAEAFERVGEVEALRVRGTVTELRDGGARSEGTYWIGLSDGWIVKAEVQWFSVPFGGSPFPVNARIEVIREAGE